ncbi:hypothetical protein FACS1894184_19830 [Clostridia bacterium]|nr:hypothetical protein FACS1894184_19830 [Clostridia bacterium]
MLDLDDHYVFDDSMDLTLVYVKTVIKEYDKKSNLYLFARFFAISSQEEANAFVSEFFSAKLGKELVRLYNNAVADRTRLDKLEELPYFIERLNDEQAEAIRDKAELKGIGIGEQRGLEKGHKDAAKAMSKLGIPLASIATELGHPEGIIQQWIAQK